MDKQKRKSIVSSIPIWTVLVATGSLIAYLSPKVSSLFVYDRAAVLKGEFWRLLLSPMVHFGNAHFFYDLTAFGFTGWMVESKNSRYYWLFCTLMALCIGLFMVVAKPQMHYYGGLSGIACGSIAYLALHGLHSSRTWSILCRLVLIILPIKIGLEAYTGGSVLPYSTPLPFVPIWESHAIGTILALFCFLVKKIIESKSADARSFVK
jgi:rhomboid family GlyGly-CTERM serine protease